MSSSSLTPKTSIRLETTSSPPKSYFLPPHIQDSVAAYAAAKFDVRTLRRLTWTSASWREAGVKALKGVKECGWSKFHKMEAKPPLFIGFLSPVNPLITPPFHSARRSELVDVEATYDAHKSLYPAACLAIDKLVIEVTDWYEWDGRRWDSEWSSLLEVADQLKHLEIRLSERIWRGTHTDDNHAKGDNGLYRLYTGITGHGAKIWDVVLGWEPFPWLESFTLGITSDLVRHLMVVVNQIYIVRRLVLHCPHDPRTNISQFTWPADNHRYMPHFELLHDLTISAPQTVTFYLLDLLVRSKTNHYSRKNLLYLTLSLTDWNWETSDRQLLATFPQKLVMPNIRLRGLAIYGLCVYQLLLDLEERQRNICAGRLMSGVEEIEYLCLEQTAVDEDGYRLFPLISNAQERPVFPKLRDLIWVLDQNKSHNYASPSTWISISEAIGLFKRYPNLRRIRLVYKYPRVFSDPSNRIIVACMIRSRRPDGSIGGINLGPKDAGWIGKIAD